MSSKEIVTLQVGHYSNFIGTHWWNIQNSSFVYDPALIKDDKELNHDVLFREGETLRGHVTYTPRLICYDLKGSLYNLKKDGSLYDDSKQEDDIKWHGDVTLHKSGPLPKNEYLRNLDEQDESTIDSESQDEDKELVDVDNDSKSKEIHMETEDVTGPQLIDLDDSVKVWSEFLGLHLHPKSISIINDYLYGNDDQPFDVYGLGSQTFSPNTEFFEEQFENKLHFFVEECDHLQGFHILADTYNSFGGASSRILQYLDDEFSSKAIFTFGSTPSSLPNYTDRHRAHRCINSLLSYHSHCEHSSLFLPLSMSSTLWKDIGLPVSLPYLKYNADIDYHTSAILAASLDNLTLPYRHFTIPAHIRDITHTFNGLGRKCASLSACFPFPLMEDGTMVDYLMSLDGDSPLTSITPCIQNKVVPKMQSCTLRGIPAGHVNRKSQSSPTILSQCTTAEEVIQLYLTEMYSKTLNAGQVFRDPCNVVAPYPHIFRSNVTREGFISGRERLRNQGVEKVPIMTSLQSTEEISVLMDSLVEECSKFNLKQYNEFIDSGLECDEYKEILDNLRDLSDCYK